MKTFESLRKTYPIFLYKNHTNLDAENELQVTYHFKSPGLSAFDPS